MSIVLIILGAVLIYLGATMKISSKKVSEMGGVEIGKLGLKWYGKIMCIAGGIGLILIGLIIYMLS